MRQPVTVELGDAESAIRGSFDECALDGTAGGPPGPVEVTLTDGRRLLVPRDSLERVEERRYRLRPGAEHAAGTWRVVVPVLGERARVVKRATDAGGVRVSKVVREEEQAIDLPLAHDEVSVERVPVGRFIDTVPPTRREGDDCWVIPIVEEVLVVEKRLMLKEELRVRKTVVEAREPQTITLRREEPVIERLEPKPSVET